MCRLKYVLSSDWAIKKYIQQIDKNYMKRLYCFELDKTHRRQDYTAILNTILSFEQIKLLRTMLIFAKFSPLENIAKISKVSR
jgi:hypothetical protein